MEKFDCILIVDDDAISNYLTRRLLEFNMEMATSIFTAVNGEDAISFIKQYYVKKHTLPEIIFLDINMPVCDGFEFIHRFNELSYASKAEVQIVVLTTSSSSTDLDKMKSLGIKYYLNKPLNQDKLNDLFSKLKQSDHSNKI
jgi:CheY-like chemotaxis protein